jgi:hypothetical protein
MMSAKKGELEQTKPKQVIVVEDDPTVVMPPARHVTPIYTVGNARGTGALGMLMAMAGMFRGGADPLDNLLDLGGRIRRVQREVESKKKCAYCGNEHDHHNAFCSANCCRWYHEEQKRRQQMGKNRK